MLLRVRRAALLSSVVVVLGLFAAAVRFWSGVTLAGDSVALARVDVQPLGGKLVSAQAFAPDGGPIPLDVAGGRLTPRGHVVPGVRVTLNVIVRRPGWLGWALGNERHERLTLHAPVANVTSAWPTVARGAPVRVTFDQPVSVVQFGSRRVQARGSTVSVEEPSRAGAVTVRAAARLWESLGAPQTVTWFPASRSPVVLATPAPKGRLLPSEPIRLTFSRPVVDVLGSKRPVLAPSVAGSWSEPDGHTLRFTPTGFGAPLNAQVHVELPVTVAATGGRTLTSTRRIAWTVPGASFRRLQELLAQAGYLPVTWIGPRVARTARAQLSAAVEPPLGRFAWRYPNTPPELQALWVTGEPNAITRGAVMMFEDDHQLAVDGLAGPQVWRALIADTIAGHRRTGGYSYVFVHRNVPQLLTLWHNGKVVLTSPGNTGVPQAPTQLGTFPVFEHIPVGTMSGTNPNGTHYHDPGIRWISYFHGGDALHAFNRASFGTPQSLGCVELPLGEAAKLWPYTPIGTLVTIEN
jgi:peptidoglycan hydrolase-like protein with peptidoglycan-binding domain